MKNNCELKLVLSTGWRSFSRFSKSTEDDGGAADEWMTEEEEEEEDRLWRCGEFLKDSIEELPVILLVNSLSLLPPSAISFALIDLHPPVCLCVYLYNCIQSVRLMF